MTSAGYTLQSDEEAAAVCGEDTLCGRARAQRWQDSLRQDECAAKGEARDADAVADYVFWTPGYRKAFCAGSGRAACSPDVNRFAPRQVRLESFLQGRGQVASNTACPGGFLNYLPEALLEGSSLQAPGRALEQTAQHQGGKSCGTVSETDLLSRRAPLPGAYVAGSTPFADRRPPSIADEAKKVVTLGSKKHVDFAELKAEQERLRNT